MKTFSACVKRNTKMFFKDKGLFFTSLITPLILLLLYATFLSNVYKDSFSQIFVKAGFPLEEGLMNGLVGGQLMSSLLAVSCVTVSFCSNMLMVQDKVTGAMNDFLVCPINKSKLALSYYVSTTISTLIICLLALVASLVYVLISGWFLSFADVMLLLLDIIILTTFGTALSSVINFFLSSQGQISAVGSIVSSCYGFICGAYMPLSSFGEGLRNVVMFLPGTYGTSLVRNHSINGVLNAIADKGYPEQVITGIKNAVDCNIYFFGNQVETWVMYTVVCASIALLIGGYVALNVLKKKNKK